MKRTVGVEIRRYATITIEYDHEDEIPEIVEQAVQEDSPELDWNAPEVDCITTICEFDEDSALSDLTYEECREMYA